MATARASAGSDGVRHFNDLANWSLTDLNRILDETERLKRNPIRKELLPDKSLGMLFAKSSTRTRISFEVGMKQLGGYPLFLSLGDVHLGEKESIKDTAKVLSRYLDGIMARLYGHEEIVKLAKHSEIPVINGLTDLLHPCQALTDMFSIREKKGQLEGLKLAYVGDGNNVCNSLLTACAIFGLSMSVGCPSGYEPDQEILEGAQDSAKSDGGDRKIEVTEDPKEAVKDADVIYTDTWVSMGDGSEKEERISIFKPYQVNQDLVSQAKDSALVMHCLPAQRGYELTSEVMDSERSIVYDQAENRLHVQKALLHELLGDSQR